MHKVYGSCETASSKPVEAFKSLEIGSKTKITASLQKDRPVDTWWLESVSECYNISDNISDYVVVPVPIITVDIPNRNLQAFPYEEVSAWNAEAGRIVYQTFVGKPLFLDHNNDKVKEAKGVILDSVLKYIPAYDLWKIVILPAWDRTKDKDVANHILKDPKSEFSMGSYVKTFLEYPTGKKVKNDSKRGYLDEKGNLVYQILLNTTFFETSLILSKEGAADCTAVNFQDDILLRPGDIDKLGY